MLILILIAQGGNDKKSWRSILKLLSFAKIDDVYDVMNAKQFSLHRAKGNRNDLVGTYNELKKLVQVTKNYGKN